MHRDFINYNSELSDDILATTKSPKSLNSDT